MAADGKLRRTITHTSRPPREGEVDGHHYHFVSDQQFVAMREADDFLETVHIFGSYYGTSHQAVKVNLDQGHDTLLIIDWQGARNVRHIFGSATSVFVLPPSIQTLRKRLVDRAEDTADVIEVRIQNALHEMTHYDEYDYVVINDSFDVTVRQILEIVYGTREQRKPQISTTVEQIQTIVQFNIDYSPSIAAFHP